MSIAEGAAPGSTLSCNRTYFVILTNTVCNLDKYTLKFQEIHFAIWTNTISNFNKYILQFGEIHLAIQTNIFCTLYKYICVCVCVQKILGMTRGCDRTHFGSGEAFRPDIIPAGSTVPGFQKPFKIMFRKLFETV